MRLHWKKKSEVTASTEPAEKVALSSLAERAVARMAVGEPVAEEMPKICPAASIPDGRGGWASGCFKGFGEDRWQVGS